MAQTKTGLPPLRDRVFHIRSKWHQVLFFLFGPRLFLPSVDLGFLFIYSTFHVGRQSCTRIYPPPPRTYIIIYYLRSNNLASVRLALPCLVAETQTHGEQQNTREEYKREGSCGFLVVPRKHSGSWRLGEAEKKKILESLAQSSALVGQVASGEEASKSFASSCSLDKY